MIQYVYPFSFREYLSSNGVQLDKLWIYKNRSEEMCIRDSRCVETLLPAGEEAEIILVDDGSKDDTGKIADAYACLLYTSRCV